MSKNVVCWFEIYVDDIERAKKFYGTVLNTTFQDADMPTEDAEDTAKMAFFECDDMSAVSGALVYMEGARSHGECQSTGTMVYFPCEDCIVEESRVEKAGGKVINPKMSIGEHGFCSICVDSEGNSFGLHSQK